MRVRALAAAIGAALLLGGCGGGASGGAPTDSATPFQDRTGARVALEAAEAMQWAGSVHVTGAITHAGIEQAVDLHLQEEDVAGTIRTAGQELEILVTRGATYARAGTRFWVSRGMPPEIAPYLDGTWVLMPAEAAAEFGALTLDGLVEQLRDTDGLQDEVRTDERNGVAVHVVSHEDGSLLVVEANHPGYPLELRTAGRATRALHYTRFGEREDITAPVDFIHLAEFAG